MKFCAEPITWFKFPLPHNSTRKHISHSFCVSADNVCVMLHGVGKGRTRLLFVYNPSLFFPQTRTYFHVAHRKINSARRWFNSLVGDFLQKRVCHSANLMLHSNKSGQVKTNEHSTASNTHAHTRARKRTRTLHVLQKKNKNITHTRPYVTQTLHQHNTLIKHAF